MEKLTDQKLSEVNGGVYIASAKRMRDATIECVLFEDSLEDYEYNGYELHKRDIIILKRAGFSREQAENAMQELLRRPMMGGYRFSTWNLMDTGKAGKAEEWKNVFIIYKKLKNQ